MIARKGALHRAGADRRRRRAPSGRHFSEVLQPVRAGLRARLGRRAGDRVQAARRLQREAVINGTHVDGYRDVGEAMLNRVEAAARDWKPTGKEVARVELPLGTIMGKFPVRAELELRRIDKESRVSVQLRVQLGSFWVESGARPGAFGERAVAARPVAE
jgi:hypothetical protein